MFLWIFDLFRPRNQCAVSGLYDQLRDYFFFFFFFKNEPQSRPRTPSAHLFGIAPIALAHKRRRFAESLIISISYQNLIDRAAGRPSQRNGTTATILFFFFYFFTTLFV